MVAGVFRELPTTFGSGKLCIHSQLSFLNLFVYLRMPKVHSIGRYKLHKTSSFLNMFIISAGFNCEITLVNPVSRWA